MNQKRIDPLSLILLAAIVFFLALEYRLVLYVQYIMDEFLHAAWAGDLYYGTRPYVGYVPFKTQLGILLYALPFRFFGDTAGILLFSRHLAFAFTLLGLGFLFLIHRQLFGSTRGGLWAVLWTLSCTTFREHSFSIRVDMMATALALVAVHQFLVRQGWRRTLAAGLWLGVAFCVTQKASYFIVAFTVAYWLAYRRVSPRPVRDFAVFAAAGLGVFAVYVLCFGWGGHWWAVVKATFMDEKMLSLALEGHQTGLSRFYWHTFSRNMPFYCLALMGLVWAVAAWRGQDWIRNFFAAFSLVVAAILAVHREPWPYVFVFVVPFLGFHAGWLSDRIFEGLKSAPRVVIVPAAVVLLVVAIQSVRRHAEYAAVPCFLQLQAVNAAEAMLGPDDTYFDGIRMVVTRKHSVPLILEKRKLTQVVQSWQTEGPRMLEALRATQCKLLIFNYRFAKFPREFSDFVKQHYCLMDRNLFVSGCEVTSSPTEVDLVWGGRYDTLAYENCRNIAIDGKPVPARHDGIALAPGKHRCTFEGPGSFLLIPWDASKWAEPRKVEPTITPLFGEVYDR